MLLSQPILNKVHHILFLLFFMLSIRISYSQSEELSTHIQKEIHQIEEQIANKQYEQALSKVVQLESYTKYMALDAHRLEVALLKAKCLYGQENQEEAISLLLQGFSELKQKDKLPKLKIKYALYLGTIFNLAKNTSKAKAYYNISLKTAKLSKDTLNILKAYLKLGTIFYKQGEEVDSATYYYNKIITYPITSKTSKDIFKAYNNLSVINAMYAKNYELAEEYGKKHLDFVKSQNDTLGIAAALLNLSNVFYQKKEFNKAKLKYEQAYELVKPLKSKAAIDTKENLLYNLAFVNEDLQDYKKAYYYLTQATDLTDSLANASLTQNISEIEAKYNVAKEAQKVTEEKRKRERAQLLLYGSVLLFLIVSVLAYIFYRNHKLKQRNKLEQLENEVHTKIINATIDAKEKERKSIAEILHDSVSALLSSANLHLQATKAQLREKSPKEITKAQIIVNEASVKIRDLSHELISSVLLKFGLAFAVHDMCQKYSNSKITFLSDDNGVKRYEQDFEIKIHNIIEELINNILKHSKATNATIMLTHRNDDMLGIRINDDGVGFDPQKAKFKDGLGLSHINARIKIMKGVFTIETSKNNGTSIFILVPIQPREI